ncbi:MAG: hypothetical protein M3467_04065 [Actinomycetota bacterium]|nr:hypothetical protein [Actinomycetota bacterium]
MSDTVKRLVVRAEDYYTPPPSQPADAWAMVRPAERVARWYEHKQQRRLGVPEGVLLDQVLHARINHSRWVADCPCGSAQVVSPADPRFFCVECGAGWFRIQFPADVDRVEAELADQLPHLRNWQPDGIPAWTPPPAPPLTDKQAAMFPAPVPDPVQEAPDGTHHT